MSIANLKAVVAKVLKQQQEDLIQPWSEIASTASVIPEGQMPLPGEILPDIKDFLYTGAKELTLGNGMKVATCDDIPQDIMTFWGKVALSLRCMSRSHC